VAALAFAAGRFNMDFMAEDCIARVLDLVGYGAGFAFVTPYAVLLRCHAECFHAGMTGTARPRFFHFRHGVMLAALEIEQGVVADPAVVVVFQQVDVVTEHNRIGIREGKLDVFRFLGKKCLRKEQS
jgi:hypothetical protein